MIITIDGPSGTGKTTIAKKVAERLGFTYFDTGALYRSFAWYCHTKGIDDEDIDAILKLIPHFDFQLLSENGDRKYFCCGEEVTKEIRTEEISWLSSKISKIKEVRENLKQIQIDFAKKRNAVFEGRDLGTVIFPDADLKIFLTAAEKIRAERRYKEVVEKDPDSSFEEVYEKLKQRDQQDQKRAIAPLKKAADAVEIDTSHLTIDQVIESILQKYYDS